MPARRELYCGRREFLWRPWGPLEPFDDPLARILERNGYRTGIVTDHYHYWEAAGNGYLQSFQSSELVRGHELDYWQLPVRAGADLPPWVANVEEWRPGQGGRYFANVRDFVSEADYFPARVARSAAGWLRRQPHAGAPFFLQVESFDVHEPFDVPEPYASLYGDPRDRERYTLWPPYQDPVQLRAFIAQASPAELAFVRSQYRAKVTMVDHWLGTVLGALEREGLAGNTVVVVTTDHGHDLGERGAFGKQFPHFDSHARVPLMIREPGQTAANDVDSLSTTADLFATILDLAGIAVPPSTQSRSLKPALRDRHARVHDALVYGTFGQGICCTDGEWTVIKSPRDAGPLFAYSSLMAPSALRLDRPEEVTAGHHLPGVRVPQWKIPVTVDPLSHEDLLFHTAEDPDQTADEWSRRPEQRRRLLTTLREVMDEEGYPAEQLGRLGLDRV